MSEQAILRALAAGPQTTPQLQMRLSGSLAKPLTAQIVLNLHAAGKIAMLKGNRWQLTSLGRAMLPTAAPRRDWGQYVPPVHVRREGSEVAGKLPSVFAGRRVER